MQKSALNSKISAKTPAKKTGANLVRKFITKNSKETKNLGKILAQELKNISSSQRKENVICLSGDLGSGKTTFTQGLLEELGAKGPYTSPTFVIMKNYHITHSIKHKTKKFLNVPCSVFRDIYHIDAYRVTATDILDIGWKEIIAENKNIVIVEWAERAEEIIPKNSIWIKFKWIDENRRELFFSRSLPKPEYCAKNTSIVNY